MRVTCQEPARDPGLEVIPVDVADEREIHGVERGRSGEHQLEVSVIGKLDDGKDFAQTESFTFTKDVEPRLMGLALASPGPGRRAIVLETW